MAPVRRRSVFFVGGFDPRAPATYHALYREQAALQAQAGGLELQVGPRRRLPSGNAAWQVRAPQAGVDTRYEILRWDGLVRSHWTQSRWRLWMDVLTATLRAPGAGVLVRLLQRHRRPAVVMALPFLLGLAATVGVPLLAWGVAAFGGLLPAAAVAMLCWAGLLHLHRAWSSDWIGRSFAFTMRLARGQVPALEPLLERHADTVAERLRSGVDDEVLVVGHSSGSLLAASIAARALARLDRAPASPLALLTLGQCIPMLGLAPDAHRFRGELRTLATAEGLSWVDIASPADACCFALTDPLAASGIDAPLRPPGQPLLRSPRFHLMFDVAEYGLRKRDRFALHFQYLMAGQRPACYDYFALTAGPLRLEERVAREGDSPGGCDGGAGGN